MRFVLDTSVTMAWLFEEERTEWTEALLGRLAERDEALVPRLWAYEVVNVIVLAERRGRITPAQANVFLDGVEGLGIRVEAEADGGVFSSRPRKQS